MVVRPQYTYEGQGLLEDMADATWAKPHVVHSDLDIWLRPYRQHIPPIP
jgi:hypothetical protein